MLNSSIYGTAIAQPCSSPLTCCSKQSSAHLQGKIWNVVCTAATVLAAHHRFVDMLQTECSHSVSKHAIPNAQSDCVPGSETSTFHNQRLRPSSLYTSNSLNWSASDCTTQSDVSGRNMYTRCSQQRKNSTSLSNTFALEALEEFKAAVPGMTDDTAHFFKSEAHPWVMCAVGSQLRDIMSQLSVPSVYPTALRLKGHQHNSELHRYTHSRPSQASEDAHSESGHSTDYLNAVLANTYLCEWLQLGQQGSAEFQRIVRTCEGLAVNFLWDHGASIAAV